MDKNLLVVDDNPSILLSIRKFRRKDGSTLLDKCCRSIKLIIESYVRSVISVKLWPLILMIGYRLGQTGILTLEETSRDDAVMFNIRKGVDVLSIFIIPGSFTPIGFLDMYTGKHYICYNLSSIDEPRC